MAVKRRFQAFSGQRVDIPHLLSLESAVSNDFDEMLRGLVTGLNKPYLVRGFEIVVPDSGGPASNLQIAVADSAVLHSSATESGTILYVPAGTANEVLDTSNTKVIGAFQNGVKNYVSLDYRRVSDTSTIDNVAGWSAAQKIEYQRTAPLGKTLEYRFIISSSGFSTNLPLYIVKVSPTGGVEHITKGTGSLFRLGTGGSNPDSGHSYNFGGLVNSQIIGGTRREWINNTVSGENSLTVAPGEDPNALKYGDFAITNLKEWMDAIMTRFKEVTGSNYWYLDSSLIAKSPNMFDTWSDTAGSNLTGAGSISYNYILEALQPTIGAFQDQTTDRAMLPTDSYTLGVTTGTKAILSGFNAAQLVINSVTNPSVTPFLYQEGLVNRRIYRFDSAKMALSDRTADGFRYGYNNRTPVNANPYITVPTWSFISGAVKGNTVTVNTSTPHGFNVGDLVEVTGLTQVAPPLGEFSPSGVFTVKEVVSTTQFRFSYLSTLTASPTPVEPNAKVRLDKAFNATDRDSYRHPFLPRFKVSSWTGIGLTTATLIAPNHNFRAPSTDNGIHSGPFEITGLASTTSLRVGQLVQGPGVTAETYITAITGPTSITVSRNPAFNLSPQVHTFYDVAFVQGLTAATNAPNGRFKVTGIGGGDQIMIELPAAPTGTAGVALDQTSAFSVGYVSYDRYEFALTVTGASMEPYNVIDGQAACADDSVFWFKIGPDTIPGLGPASGAIVYDGVVAQSQVLDPLKVSGITNSGSDVLVTTYQPHQMVSNPGPMDFTIYGESSASPYFRTYSGVGITVTGPNTFTITGTDVTGQAPYVNTGSDLVFAKFSNNPYPGPIKWDSDIVVKSVIGDRRYVVPKTATAAGTSLANRFNTNGVTGTAYLQDGEVAYIVLERNKSVSAGATYQSTNGSTISGSIAPTDTLSAPLRSGDFVKYDDEPENMWFRIAGVPGTPVLTNTFYLESDRGQPVTSTQRPNRSGRLVYARGIYDVVQVAQHWQVPASADVYWLAMRRDNGSLASKVYFRGLELEVGEVRQINDNSSTNLLIYTGAGSESAINPNYSSHDTSGSYQFAEPMRVQQVDPYTRTVTTYTGPDLGYQAGDRLRKIVGVSSYTYSIKQVLSSRTVVLAEDIQQLGNITSISSDVNGVVTVVTDTPHTLSNGQTALISGVTPEVFNGSYTITVVNPTTFTYTPTVTFQGNTTIGSNIITNIPAGSIVRLKQFWLLFDGSNLPSGAYINSFPTATSIAMHPSHTAATTGFSPAIVARMLDSQVGSGGFVSKNNPILIGPDEDIEYQRRNYSITDSDDLTLAIRKEDRELAKINTQLNRPIYDESFLVQKIDLTGSGLIISGEYVYLGAHDNPTFLAWVLHGNGTQQSPDPMEGAAPTGGWPGGHPSVGPNSILVAVVSGTALHGTQLYQKGLPTGRSVNNPGNPPFAAPTIKGATVFGGNDGVEIVLPPNRRTQIAGSSYVQWPSHMTYKGSRNPIMAGEELMVIINDTIRQAEVDYLETFGGPKGKIQIARDLPANTRIRCRLMPAYGSALAAKPSGVTLQTCYDASFINNYTVYELSGKPIELITGDQPIGGSALTLTGSLLLNGIYSGNVVGGIFGTSDRAFDIGEETNRVNDLWTAKDQVKTHASHPGSGLTRFTAAYTTTGAAATVIPGSAITVPTALALGRSYRVKVKGTAWRSDGTPGTAAFELQGAFSREVGGALVATGSPSSQIVGFSGDGLNYALAFGIVGGGIGVDGDIVVVAYGNGTVQWSVSVESQMVSGST